MKTNNDEILKAALAVFSQDGYEGARLASVAELLGITKGALYKHYESKEAIFNAMIDRIEAYYSMNIEDGRLPETVEELRALTMKQLDFTLHDEAIRSTRKLLSSEQYRNERIKVLAEKHFYKDIEEYYRAVFERMRGLGAIKEGGPSVLAFEYTAPITILIHYMDLMPEKEAEIMEKIERHLDYFYETYC